MPLPTTESAGILTPEVNLFRQFTQKCLFTFLECVLGWKAWEHKYRLNVCEWVCSSYKLRWTTSTQAGQTQDMSNYTRLHLWALTIGDMQLMSTVQNWRVRPELN